MTAEARYIISEMSDFDECRECYKPEPVEEGMACVGFCGKDRRHFTCQVLTQHYKYFRAKVRMCANFHVHLHSQGDLGGAAAVKVCDNPGAGGQCLEGGTFVLSGILSWSFGCHDTYPTVMTDVRHYLDWIHTNKHH